MRQVKVFKGEIYGFHFCFAYIFLISNKNNLVYYYFFFLFFLISITHTIIIFFSFYFHQFLSLSFSYFYKLTIMLRIACKFSEFINKVPRVNLSPFLSNKDSLSDCKLVSNAFHHYGCLVVQDPRVNQVKNETFLSYLEKYFSKRQQQLDRGQMIDIYKQLSYEVGLIPPNTQQLQDESQKIAKLSEGNKSAAPPNSPLNRLRFLWNVGTVTPDIPSNKIPKDFPEMQHVLNDWGNTNMDTINTVSEMLAIGLGLPRQTFTQSLKGGATKLAPNAHDLRRSKQGEVFIGYHYDFCYLTIHGKSSFPGLYIWLANGQRIAVSIPKGHLFLQAGSQLEYLTGGYVHCGYHQAIYTSQVQELKQKKLKQGKQPWRITSTMFAHLRGDVTLQPLQPFANDQSIRKYKPIKQSQYMQMLIKRRNKQ